MNTDDPTCHPITRAAALCWVLLLATGAIAQTSDPQVALGKSIFRGEVGAKQTQARLFNARSCDECHRDGAAGIGPKGDGPLPAALVIELESPSDSATGEVLGDRVYGRIFHTSAPDGARPEGRATVHYTEIEGHYYPSGIRWRMRVPHYRFAGLLSGSLAASTIVKPRLAPALYGTALLAAVPESTIAPAVTGRPSSVSGETAWRIYRGTRALGRFGWQAASVSLRDQTTKAFAREMGLTSADQPFDDCTADQVACSRQRSAESPTISDDSLNAVLEYLRSIPPPDSPPHSDQYLSGLTRFTDLGCAACHRPELPLDVWAGETRSVISPYTDLRLHDLGIELADQTASGVRVPSKWRTAPLWGLSRRVGSEGSTTLLHDGRARSIEEAVLWHSGEASKARHSFEILPVRSRQALIRWLESL
jgi:CxxC motif-containing protein (DUF1111 family)